MNNIKEFSHNIGLNWMCGKDARTPVNPGVVQRKHEQGV